MDVLFGPPPPGGDVDRGPIVYGTYWAFFAISTVVLALRFWARLKIRALGWDDWAMAVAVVGGPSLRRASRGTQQR